MRATAEQLHRGEYVRENGNTCTSTTGSPVHDVGYVRRGDDETEETNELKLTNRMRGGR